MFRHPFTGIVSGSTGSGKSYWTRELILSDKIQPPPQEIYWCYTEAQPWMESLAHRVTFLQGLPDDLEDLCRRKCRTLVILDDLMTIVGDSQRVSDLYTRVSHHNDTSVLTLVQNLFFRAKFSRNIQLNAHYLVLFRNCRDVNQVQRLASQMYPGKTAFMMDAFHRATAAPHSCLVVDCHPRCPEEHRLRGDCLAKYPIVYVPR